MIDLVQAQDDVTGALLSAESLLTVAVKSYRQMRISQEIDYRTMLTAGRNGRNGAAVIVLMPEAGARNPNVSGPILDWEFGVVVIEHDAMNLLPQTGTLLSAEEIGQRVMDVLHHEADEKLGVLAVSGRPMFPEKEFVFPGCIGYRVNLTLSAGKCVQTGRCAPVGFVQAGSEVTLTCATAGARIKYTLDGTFPGDDSAANASSLLYSAAVTVVTGETLRAAAYKTGLNKGPTLCRVVS